MNRFYFLIVTIFFFAPGHAQIINFPDANFKAKLLQANASLSIAKNLLWQNTLIDTNDDGEIDAAEAANIAYLNIHNSNIASLEGLSFFINLKSLFCENNLLVALDVSPLHQLTTLYVEFNPNLIYLNLKNGLIGFNVPPPPPAPPGIGGANFNECPSLSYVCVDDDLLSQGQLYLNYYYSTANIVLNSYCSFVPGGQFYTIQGTAKFDADSDGCNVSDPDYPHLKLSFDNGTFSTTTIADETGDYIKPLLQGTYTITPILENPAYFTNSPTTATVAFPATASPFTQNFCITANGIHSDLEVNMLPLNNARPGFDVNYKIIYKNKGTHAQSGLINFGFNDAVLDFLTASPLPSGQIINYRSWNFTNLQPFETREIFVTLNVNSPVETPPVTSGFILNYTLAINSDAIDETPQDNTFVLNQSVINSLDPNDKTCLEGAVITPEMVGKEVHYIIRFENSGTANAQNIVVKDMIDTDKFDISSLIPIDGSHSFVTKISNGNQVEFIFENINLPFDDANNDGFVAFKIKTKPTLVLGDTFNNMASIYFDYNAAIVTNTASTTVGALARIDFEFENYFRIYPNPADMILNVDSKKQIEITSISIYNTLGQLVMIIPTALKTTAVDVSGLKTGNYFIRINSDKGTSNAKFIKM